MELSQPTQPATRRRHSKDLKARVLAECAVPGASVAAIALSHGLNANLVHRWRRLAASVVLAAPTKTGSPTSNDPRFVAVALPTAPVPAPLPDIRIELRRGATAIAVTWPVSSAAECAAWLGGLLR